MQLFWHRQDLRVPDNLGLADATAAAQSASGESTTGVVPLFVFDDQILQHAGAPRVAFLLDALQHLRAAYRDRGSDLLVRQGDPSSIVPEIAVDHDIDRVVWNHDYSGLAEERDDAVRAALTDEGIPYDEFHDAVLHEPGTIRTNEGEPYSVYTYFWKKWRDREKQAAVDAPDPSELVDPHASGEFDSPHALPELEDLGFEEPDATLPGAGTAAARDRLEGFLSDDVFRYEAAREYPARDATSRLSQDLAFGTIGIREVHEAVVDAFDAVPDEDARESVRAFQSQLAWREFYTQVLYFHQRVVTENYKSYSNPIEWRNDTAELAAWKAGETGYPIVDAGMRQLTREAFIHNRVRMIVASFLTKDLLWDWRAGYAHFREHLVDHDTANDNGGWQWAASTGTDAQPYFRIFNPQTQGERYDPDADYITHYVPELTDVDPQQIHNWPALDPDERAELAPDYVEPIVEHSDRRPAAIAMFEAARSAD